MSKRDKINKDIEAFIGIEHDVDSHLDGLDDETMPRESFDLIQYTPVTSKVPVDQRESDVYDDYNYTRTVLMLAKESEHPRAFEVSSTLMKNISEMSKDLMELHKHLENEKGDKKAKTVNNTQNNNYYSTDGKPQKGVNDLLDDLDDNKKK
jgi:hypothetical protein